MNQTTINFDKKPKPLLPVILEGIKIKTSKAKEIVEIFKSIESTEDEILPRGMEIRMTAVQAIGKFDRAAAAYIRGVQQIGNEFEEEGDSFLHMAELKLEGF